MVKTEKKKVHTLILDMDNVLVDFVQGVEKLLDTQCVLPSVQHDQLSLAFPGFYWETIAHKVHQKGPFFRDLGRMPGAERLQSWAESLFRTKGVNVALMSRAMRGHTQCWKHKYTWVRDHMGLFWAERLMLVGPDLCKSQYVPDYGLLVDDHVGTIQLLTPHPLKHGELWIGWRDHIPANEFSEAFIHDCEKKYEFVAAPKDLTKN